MQNWYLQSMGIQVYEEKPANELNVKLNLPMNWKELESQVSTCRTCPLHKTRSQTVFGVGNHEAKIIFVGEAPGEQEDLRGEPFVGRAGQLLDQMLFSIGLKREQVYIANILKCRPPSNRDPSPEEQKSCTPFLLQQLQLLKPKLIVSLGRISAQYLLQTKLSLGRLRNQMHVYSEANIPLLVTYHPAYLLRSPSDKAKAWEDFLKIRKITL